jgi:hypothetical protein
VVVAASLLLVPQFVAAADLDVEIQDMKQRLEAMESQIQAQSAELTDARAMVAAQQVQIDQTETLVTDERDAVSALSSFLESTDISGFVAAGWNYADTNTDDNVDGTSSFNLDQAWITMNKASTADSRAGFNLELQMGEMALETQGGVPNSTSVGLYAASVSYLAPVGSGLLIDAGILATALGAEVEAQNGNWQISRGAVFALQPITNTGATASYGLTDNISVMVGVLNDPFASDRNNTDGSLGLTSQVSYSQDNFGLNVGYNYGSSDAVDERNGILDIVATLDVNDNISAWVNYDYVTNETAAGADGPSTQGLAVAGRVGVMDGTGISGRFEYVSTSSGTDVETDKQTTYTVTVDHALTAGLTGKFEYRYNDVDLAGGVAGNPGNEIAVQLLYQF